MGDVYAGFDETLARRVALKVLHRDASFDAESRARLVREARTLSKLDHPNICRIYDFIENGDSDVLVLELIDGQTLEQALADGLSFAEKLRIAGDVASVLMTAHRAGVLHRDLKPENVMLTKSGDVKVLDFGLARWVEQKTKSGRNRALSADVIEEPLRMAVPDERWQAIERDATAIMQQRDTHETPVRLHHTAYGVTVGTPLFMSPEQARGEELTTASDIYSFGLMLQAMFSGREPYPDGLDAHDILLFAARGQSLPVTGIRHDVAVLIKALKAFAPSDRPTAADAVQRIEHIVGAPKRMLRDAIAAAVAIALLLGGWKYTTTLQRAETEARTRRSQANALIGFMLGDLREKLEPVGKLDILDGVSSKALEYLSSLDPKTLTAEELAQTSQALTQLGEVRSKQAKLAAAVIAFQKALELANEAHRRSPTDDNTLTVGLAHFWIGSALLTKGDAGAALPEMQAYRAIAEELARKHPHDRKYQLERAYGYSAVAKALEKSGDLAGGVAEYRVAEGIKRELAAGAPDDTKLAAGLALSLNNLALALENLGNLTEARGYYEREFAIFDSLVRLDPKRTDWKDRLANSHSYQAALLESLGDSDGALAHSTAALAIYRDLAAYDPANAQWRRNWAVTQRHQADLLRISGRVDEAIAEAQAAESQIAAVVVKERRTSWLVDEAVIRTTIARALHAGGRDDAARAEAEAAVARLMDVEHTMPKINLAKAYLALGDAVERTDRARAGTAWAAAAALMSTSASHPNPKLGAVYAQAMIRLGQPRGVGALLAGIRRTGYRQFDFEKSCAMQ